MQLRLLLFGFIFPLYLFSFGVAFAQQESTSILMNIIPANPAPGENVNITLSSYAENLDIATITWFVNGKNTLSGIGRKTISINAPALGFETVIVAKIKFQEEETQISTTIKPSRMVLLWQAMDSYVPPFYKGKALPTPDTFVKVVALPEITINGVQVDPKNLTYSWQQDFDNMPSDSGYGKNSFEFKNDYLENSNNIGVTAYTADQKYSSQGRTNIGIYQSILNFYKKDNSMGILWEKALTENHFIKNNETIVAAPYFISPKDIRNPLLVFKWYIDRNLIQDSFWENTLPLTKLEGGFSGTSTIKLEIENIDKIFQYISKEIDVQF